jgi:hypothetical protein
MMCVVRPQPVARLELVQAASDLLAADPGVLARPALAFLGAIPLVAVQIEGLHDPGGYRGVSSDTVSQGLEPERRGECEERVDAILGPRMEALAVEQDGAHADGPRALDIVLQ